MGFCCFCWCGVLGPINLLLSLPTHTVWWHFSEGLRLEVTGGYIHPRQSLLQGTPYRGIWTEGQKVRVQRIAEKYWSELTRTSKADEVGEKHCYENYFSVT